MSAMGSVLFKTRRLQARTSINSEQLLVDSLINLLTRLATDAANGGKISEAITNASADWGESLWDGIDLASLAPHFHGLYQSVDSWIDTLVVQISAVADDPSQGIDLLVELITDLLNFVTNLNTTGIRSMIDFVFDGVEMALGGPIDVPYYINAWLDVVVNTLNTPLADETDSERANRQAIRGLIRQIKGQIAPYLSEISFSRDTIAQSLSEVLDDLGLDTYIDQFQDILDEAKKVVEAGTTIGSRVPFSGLGTASVGAGEGNEVGEEYLHYASWLFGKDCYRVVDDDFNVTVKIGDETHTPDPLFGERWYHINLFEQNAINRAYSFEKHNAETMEDVAKWTSVAQNFVEAVAHLISLETNRGGAPGEADWLSNLFNSAWHISHGFVKIFKPPLPDWADWLARSVLTFFMSFEDIHTSGNVGNRVIFWLTLLGKDVVEMVLFWDWTRQARNIILASMTLVNHKTDWSAPNKRPLNINHFLPWYEIGVEMFLWAFVFAFVPRSRFTIDFGTGNLESIGEWIGYIALATVVGGPLFGSVIPLLMIGPSDYKLDDFAEVWKKSWVGVLHSLLKFWIYEYIVKDGWTGGGTWNDNRGNFTGYPDQGTSPYLLPFDNDVTQQCAQGHVGIWSHHNLSGGPQIYAVDFAMDAGDIILASRGGTVVDYFDWVPDDQNVQTPSPVGATVAGQTTQDNWNFVAIRHDNIVAAHDGQLLANLNQITGLGLTAGELDNIVTFGIYGHGQNGSVRQQFNRMGILPANIIGTVVNQGDPIMTAGDTGISAYNHLHFHVVVEVLPRPGGALPGGTDAPLANALYGQVINLVGGGLTYGINQTIPFVYNDVGRVTALRYYTSQNTSTI